MKAFARTVVVLLAVGLLVSANTCERYDRYQQRQELRRQYLDSLRRLDQHYKDSLRELRLRKKAADSSQTESSSNAPEQ